MTYRDLSAHVSLRRRDGVTHTITMVSSEDCPIDYEPNHFYTIEEFLALNDWLETHEFIVDGIPISHFERESDGRLVPIPPAVFIKEAAVGEIFGQLRDWNRNNRQYGVPTTSSGGFNFGGAIKAPDVAFTPGNVVAALDEQQLSTFQGAPFSPTFAVEVDDLSTTSTLNTLTSKFKDDYFPSGVQLGWLIDPVNKTIYTFMRGSDGVVQRRSHQWYGSDGNARTLKGGEVLPGFVLELEEIDDVLSTVWPRSCLSLLQF